MLYKPKFCCNCGEKIERTQWTLFSSRRFCELCETERKGPDYLVRAFVIGALLFGAFGTTGYLRSSGEVQPRSPRSEPPASVTRNKAGAAAAEPQPAALPQRNLASTAQSFTVEGPAGVTPPSVRPSSPEKVYYCGAATKKGTPCSRRVKKKGYCWQHRAKTTGSQTALDDGEGSVR